MIDRIFSKNLLLYYAVLLLILVSWTNIDSLPPLILRLVYLSAMVVPLWYTRNSFTPEILLTFVVISGSSFAVSYMPVDGVYISIVFVITYILVRPNVSRISLPYAFVVLAMLSLFVDLNSTGEAVFSYKLIAIILACLFVSKSEEATLKLITYSNILISFVLGLEFIIMGNKFMMSVSTINGVLDRKGWSDPNYFGAVLGYGVISSLIALMLWTKMNKKIKWVIYVNLFIALYAILSTASRGIFVAIVGSLVFFLVFGSISKKKKFAILFATFLGVLVFYQLGFFDLLLLRFQSDAGDVGGRTHIWGPRLHAFFNECNTFQQCFGLGITQSRFLGTSQLLGSHNDYIAILTSYGYLGLLSLFSIILYPIRKAKEYKSFVLVAILYMAACMFSIEPFIGGHWSLYYFYIYILLLSQYRPCKVEN